MSAVGDVASPNGCRGGPRARIASGSGSSGQGSRTNQDRATEHEERPALELGLLEWFSSREYPANADIQGNPPSFTRRSDLPHQFMIVRAHSAFSPFQADDVPIRAWVKQLDLPGASARCGGRPSTVMSGFRSLDTHLLGCRLVKGKPEA